MSFWIRVNIHKIKRYAKQHYGRRVPRRQTVDAEVISVEDIEDNIVE